MIANCLEGLIEVTAFTFPPKPTFYDPYAVDDNTDSEPELFLSFDGRYDFGPSSQAAILGQMCSMLPISNLECLSISALDIIPAVDWYDLFQHCTKITTIQVRGHGTRSFLQSLAPPNLANIPSGSKGKKKKGKRGNTGRVTLAQPANSTAGDTWATTATIGTTPFSGLTCLFLQTLDFNDPVSHPGALHDVLINVLRRRNANKSPVETLTIDRCDITSNWVDKLRMYVGELLWDGDEGFSYNEWDYYEYT
jgi:hypothetical protein